jgi:MFS family permease
MIAVALVQIAQDFKVSVGSATWLISAFYLTGAVGQPLMGRLADLFGPRRVFISGLSLVAFTGVLALWVPSLGWLIGLRILQALGTSAAYPAGLAIFRREAKKASGMARPPTGALGILSITANVSAALGPTLGGFLVVAGWQAIFLVNIPLTLLGVGLGLRLLPPDEPTVPGEGEAPNPAGPLAVLRLLDLPGVFLFSGTLTGLLFFLLSLSGGPPWWLLPVIPVLAALLLYWEWRADRPFLNVRMLKANGRLVGVYLQFATVNLVFYSLFFGLPLWFEQVRNFSPGLSGLIMLPFAGMGVIATFIAVPLIHRSGVRTALVTGASALAVGTLFLLLLNEGTPIFLLVLITVILGIPNGFQSLGLQNAMYEAAPPSEIGSAAGQFQTFRYVGSILSTSLLGLIFGGTITTDGLHLIGLILGCTSILLFFVALRLKS